MKKYHADNLTRIKERRKRRRVKDPVPTYYLKKAYQCRKKGGDITPTQLRDLYNKQKGICALTGRKMLLALKSHNKNCMSVDRIKHGRPYTISNIRLVVWQVNSARGMWSDRELLELCRDVLARLPLAR